MNKSRVAHLGRNLPLIQSVPFLILFSVIMKIDPVKYPVFWFPSLNTDQHIKERRPKYRACGTTSLLNLTADRTFNKEFQVTFLGST